MWWSYLAWRECKTSASYKAQQGKWKFQKTMNSKLNFWNMLGNFDLKFGQVSYWPRRSWSQKKIQDGVPKWAWPGRTYYWYHRSTIPGFQREISNGHKLKDLDETFKALEKVAKAEICERKIWSSTLSSRTQNYLCIPNVETYNDMRQKRN